MKPTLLIILLLLTGCAAEPTSKEYLQVRSNMDIAAAGPVVSQPISWRRGADLTGDGKVNLQDLAIIAYWWGSEYGEEGEKFYDRVERLERLLLEMAEMLRKAEERLREIDPEWFK